MKELFDKIQEALKRFLRPLAATAAGSICAFALSASAQVTNGVIITVTNQPAIVTTTATSNILSWVKIQGGGGISLSWRFNQSGASTSNATVNVYSVVHGTNTVSTVPFAQLIAPSTGVTDVIANTNWDQYKLQAYEYLVIGNIANTTALTTLTNKGITVRRTPN